MKAHFNADSGMTTRLPWPSVICRPSLLLPAAFALFAPAPRTQAQDDPVTISAAGFQRLVYSGHLLTAFYEKPELDASLRVLLELHRRNPHVAPETLADLTRQALQLYRATAPAYIRTSGFQDEILAAYLEAYGRVPKPAGLVPVTLHLLNRFMLHPEEDAGVPVAELIHSGNQRLLASVGQLEQRALLLEAGTLRAQQNTAFARALDALFVAETSVSVTDTPAAIIGNPESALLGNPTMTALLTLSAASGDGSLTVLSD